MFRKRQVSSGPPKRMVVACEEEEEEIVLVSSKRPAVSPHPVEPLLFHEEEEGMYSKANLAALKSESVFVKPTPQIAPSSQVLVSGEEAINLIREHSPPPSPSSEGGGGDDEQQQVMEVLEEEEGETKLSSIGALVSDLSLLQAKLYSRRSEFESLLATSHPAQTTTTTTSQQRLEYAQYRRQQIQALQLYTKQLVSCLSAKMAMIDATQGDLWGDVREEFASSHSVINCFALWYREDPQEFTQHLSANTLAQLLFPFLLWRIKQDPTHDNDWPEIKQVREAFGQEASGYASSLTKYMTTMLATRGN
ncbi:hypothetical protein BASA81_000432 [Batrachochytrium salamandrivorans]|nr:hypothetical protein BASA81_000432 [Batrachochytrium salamandrivorans]